MLYISAPASGGFPTIDFLQASIPRALHFTRSDMQHNNYPPYVPSTMANDNAYSHLSPTPEEQPPQSYGDLHRYHASQFPSSHGQPNDGRYFAGSGSGQIHNQELAWGSGIQQPFDSHNADIPHHTRNIHQSFPASPFTTQFPHTNLPYHMDGNSSHLNAAGPVDPNTGMIFYPSMEGPRLRTAQACQKCRIRKAKCSGEHPSCERCVTRGLVCEYAHEGRARGPNKPKLQVDPMVTPGPSRRASHYGVDPVSGAGTSGQRPHNSAEFSGDFITRRGSSAGTPSRARSTPIMSPGINSPLFGAEMTMESQYQENSGSWFTR